MTTKTTAIMTFWLPVVFFSCIVMQESLATGGRRRVTLPHSNLKSRIRTYTSNRLLPLSESLNRTLPSMYESIVTRITRPSVLFNASSIVITKIRNKLDFVPYYYGNRYGSGIYAVYHDPRPSTTTPKPTTLDMSNLVNNWYRNQPNKAKGISNDEQVDVSRLNTNWFKIK